MSSNIPTQLRTIDPFSSYNSNVVNQLTRMITRNENAISGSTSSLDIIIDSTSTETGLILLTGIAYKDDVIIEITENFSFDMGDVDFYLSSDHFNETGYYYITLKYTYVKSKPAPESEIIIFRPSERSTALTGGYLFLKAVYVDFIDGKFVIVSTHNYDPENTSVKREYTKTYVCIEDTLPTYNFERDNGRTIYVIDRDEMFFGTSQTWESFNAVRTNIDTTGCDVGELVYIGSDQKCYPAIASSIDTFADAIVIQEGLYSDGTGKVRLYGEISNVKIETGITVSVGDKLYLSETEAGTVTNLISEPYNQGIGTVRSVDGSTCTIWFTPNFAAGSGGSGSLAYDKYHDLLLESVFSTLFIDGFTNISYIDPTSTAQIDTSTYNMTGDTGDIFISLNLTDPTCDETCITKCQITADMLNENNITWYVSNNGGIDWQLLYNGLDRIHTFATVEIPVTNSGGYLTVGEWCEGLSSGKRGVVILHTDTKLLLAFETGSNNWTTGEIIVGDDSTNQVTSSGDYINLTNNMDLRVKCVWSGSASILDYCVLYIEDTLKNETSVINELNIETLFSDLYYNGIINNDGNRIYPFLDTVAFPTLNVINRYSTIAKAIVDLDNILLNVINGFGQFDADDTTPSVIDHYSSYYTSDDSTANLTITYLDDPFDSQQVNIIHKGGFDVTIKNGASMKLASGSDFVMQQYDTISLIYSSALSCWIEKSRSNN